MLRIRYRMTQRNMPHAMGRGSGPQGRINRLKQIVTALFRYERIEGKWYYLDEARGYAELLVQEAHRHGDQHPATMELADFWLNEKDVIHKLFKVLVPRFSEAPACTRMYRLPDKLPGGDMMGVLELKGNPWPPVVPKERDLSGSLVNILLEEAKKDHRSKKSAKSRQNPTWSNDIAKQLKSLNINESEGTPV